MVLSFVREVVLVYSFFLMNSSVSNIPENRSDLKLSCFTNFVQILVQIFFLESRRL